jgi:hypothetical protein
MKADEKDVTRRDAIKGIAGGVTVLASLPVLGSSALGDVTGHGHMHQVPKSKPPAATYKLRFFTADENATVIEMSERIIPADDSSPGAKAAKVNEFIDLMVSESPEDVKKQWREGLTAITQKSRSAYGKPFHEASTDQQIALLTEISANEKAPKTIEERFFRTIKNSTVDGYYTSEIGIHSELKYKGNSYAKEFPGCTHPEHKG